MLADYVMKGIDNLFQQKLSVNQKKQSNTISSSAFNNNNAEIKDNGSFESKIENKKTNNPYFNKDYIKENLHRVIKKKNDQEQLSSEKSPFKNTTNNNYFNFQRVKSFCGNQEQTEKNLQKFKRSVSPVTKSRLKLILEHNKQQRIRSVVKSKKDLSQSKSRSPYTKIQETITQLSRVNTTATINQLNSNDISINQYSSQFQNKSSMQINKNDKISHYRQQRKDLSKSKVRPKIFLENQQNSQYHAKSSQIIQNNNEKSKLNLFEQNQMNKSRSKIFRKNTSSLYGNSQKTYSKSKKPSQTLKRDY